MVTLIPEWPIISCTTLECSPLVSMSVAKLSRSAWNGMSGSSARRSSGLKDRLKTLWRLRGVPTSVVNTRSESCQSQPRLQPRVALFLAKFVLIVGNPERVRWYTLNT
jgi:hypothetical protein